MSKKQIFLSAIILVVLSFLCIFIYKNAKPEDLNKTRTKLYVTESKNCSEKVELYYTDSKGTKYYTHCLDSIVFDFGDRKLELKSALELKQITISDVLYELSEQEIYKDGGSILYRDNSKISDKGISILKCQTIEGNEDYYIGNKNMVKQDNFCLNADYSCNFIRTYQVLDVSLSSDELYLYFTLKQFQSDDITTVKISKELGGTVEEDLFYEFTFKSLNKKYKDNIKAIFDNNELTKIELTKKEGLDQIQESICD